MAENMYLPILATRGIIVFPGCETNIEVGRKKSLIAVDVANSACDGNIIIVSQRDPQINEPKFEEIAENLSKDD